MMRALGIAATGMQAQQTNVEVISNNIANVSTTGFKRSMPAFVDLLYQIEFACRHGFIGNRYGPADRNADGTWRPSGRHHSNSHAGQR